MRRLARAWLVLLLALVATPSLAEPTLPKFTGFVVDAANVLPPQVEADLTAKLAALQRDTKRQLVVATIPDLQGYPIADYGVRLGRGWGVGLNNADNGAILFIAPNEGKGQRGPRIEVGRGLEPFLTDAFSYLTIQQQMMPRLRDRDIPGAMTAGTDALIAQLRASPEEAKSKVDAAVAAFDRERASKRGGSVNYGAFIFWGAVFLFVILPMMLRGSRGRRYRGGGSTAGAIGEAILWTAINAAANSRSSGSGWSGGGSWGGGDSGGGGGWGGGGFSGGGGGDFGGGGASGDW